MPTKKKKEAIKIVFSPLSELYDMAQVATFLGVHKRTVNREINRGKLKAHKVGNVYRIRREDLDAYLQSVVVQPDV